MKKFVKPITALFLALSITGCSSSPDELPSELVSVDFGGSQSAEISASQNDSSEEVKPDDDYAKALEKLLSLGNGLVSCNADGNVEYNGGVMELSCTIKQSCNSEEAFTDVSTGCLIAINGVLQKISCGEQKDEYMYIQTFEKDDSVVAYWNKEKSMGRLWRQNSELLLQTVAIIKGIFDVDKKHTIQQLADLYKTEKRKMKEA